MSDTNLTIDRDDIETGAFVETVTSGGRLSDDTIKAGIVEGIETEYNHVTESEKTYVVLTDGEETHRVNVKHFEDDNDSVRVTEYHVSEDNDDGDDEDEQEIVTDGGEDVTAHVSDETIEDAIESQDGPIDHPETATVEEIRDALAWVQQGITEHWSDWLSNVENNESTVVYEGRDVIVFATGEDNVPRRDLRDHYDGDLSERAPDVVSKVHHQLARDLCEYDWGYEYPLVVRKPEKFDAGQEYVEAVVNGLQQRGLSPGQAWAYYGVEIRGNSMNNWGLRKGDHDHKNVSDALEKAKRKLP